MEHETLINHQLQQLRVQQLSQTVHDSSYFQRQVNVLKQHKEYCSNKIGWELCENQKDVKSDRKRVHSCILYIGFWHDEFIKNVHIDIGKLHEEASTFGTVLKISPFPSQPPYKCAFVVFESRADADTARIGLSEEFNQLFIQKITWALPPACIKETFNFDTGIGETLRLRPMKKKECDLLGHGFMRMLYGDQFIPSDIIQLCVSFYSSWFDLRIVFCDDKTGDINLNDYKIKAIPIEANLTLAHITEQIEDNMYRKAMSNEYDRLCKLTREELKDVLKSKGYYYPRHFTEQALIKDLMERITCYGYYRTMNWYKPDFDKLRWDDGWGQKRNPLVRAWLKFKQIKHIYPVKTDTITLDKELYDKEDDERLVEVPDDSLKMTLGQIKSFDEKFDTLVIEQSTVSDWKSEKRTWPRANGDDWRETLQVGDIVNVEKEFGYDMQNYYHHRREHECVIRYVYPKEHETMTGKCVVHFIGWDQQHDEILDIKSNKITASNRRDNRRLGPYGSRIRTEGIKHRISPHSSWGDYWGGEDFEETERLDVQNGVMLAQNKDGVVTYECSKYSRNYNAKKVYSKKKELRRKWRKNGTKSCDKRIENKMKKYKIHYECLAF